MTRLSDLQYRISLVRLTSEGTYELRVGPDITDPAGIFLDQDQDNTPGEPEDRYFGTFSVGGVGPFVVDIDPQGTVAAPVSSLTLTFSETIAAASFTTADVSLVGPQGAIAVTRIVPQSDDTFLLQFPPQMASGQYTLSVGPFVSDLAGVNMDQDQDNRNGELVEDVFIGRLTIDSQGPVVTAHSPTGRIVEPLSSVVVDFSEPIAAASFTVADVAITTPTGTQAATKVSRLAETRFQIEFPRQTVGGVYQLHVAGHHRPGRQCDGPGRRSATG